MLHMGCGWHNFRPHPNDPVNLQSANHPRDYPMPGLHSQSRPPPPIGFIPVVSSFWDPPGLHLPPRNVPDCWSMPPLMLLTLCPHTLSLVPQTITQSPPGLMPNISLPTGLLPALLPIVKLVGLIPSGIPSSCLLSTGDLSLLIALVSSLTPLLRFHHPDRLSCLFDLSSTASRVPLRVCRSPTSGPWSCHFGLAARSSRLRPTLLPRCARLAEGTSPQCRPCLHTLSWWDLCRALDSLSWPTLETDTVISIGFSAQNLENGSSPLLSSICEARKDNIRPLLILPCSVLVSCILRILSTYTELALP